MDDPGLAQRITGPGDEQEDDQDDENEEEGEDEKEEEDGPPDSSVQQPWTTALSKPWPSITGYFDMLYELSQFKTQGPEEDLLNAASGLVAAFGRHFPGRMISGLPESCFDLAMLWRVRAQSSRNPRRPSWTWAGWQQCADHQYPWGLMHSPEVDGADHVVVKDWCSVEIIPLVRWSVGDAPGLSSVHDRLQLDSMRWHEAREAFRDPGASLPPGWYRVMEGQAKEALGSFWYPPPMRNDKLEHSPPINKRYLFAALEISRKGFYVHRADWPTQSQDQFVTHTCTIRTFDSIFHGPSTGAEEAGASARTGVELVAISRGQTRKMNAPYPECEARPEWRDWRDKNWRDKWYEFYNVIWVKWRVDEGTKVAERRGIGRVSRDVWEAAQKDTEDIVLG
ncbi:hypothetical protein GE09DRAFT_1230700 [Coniochaeta sp. 2T2.1]|nr:hypothetical protein GE09DRAFT_1230700 [Coniochaeta sp. 2T2.1]